MFLTITKSNFRRRPPNKSEWMEIETILSISQVFRF